MSDGGRGHASLGVECGSHLEYKRTAVRRSLHRMVRFLVSIVAEGWRAVVGFLVVDRSISPELTANNLFKLFEV